LAGVIEVGGEVSGFPLFCSKPSAQSTKCRVQVPGFKVQVPSSRFQVPGSRFQGPGSKVQVFGFQVFGFQVFGFQVFGFQVWVLEGSESIGRDQSDRKRSAGSEGIRKIEKDHRASVRYSPILPILPKPKTQTWDVRPET
jgi:hypothetical protein